MLRKFFAGLVLFIFGILFLPYVLAFSIYDIFSDEDFYTGPFVEFTYDLLIEELPVNLSSFGEEFEMLIDEEALRGVLENVFTREDLTIIIDDFIEQFKVASVSTLEDGRSVLEVTVPLAWLSAKGEAIAEGIANFLYESLEPCASLQDFNPNEFNCIPSSFPQIDFVNKFKSSFDTGFLADLPGDFVFNMEVPSNIKGNLSSLISDFAIIVFLIGGAILVFLLLLMGLIVFRPWMRILKWEAKALFLACFWVFLVAMIFLYIPGLLENFIDVEGVELYLQAYSFIVGSIVTNLLYYLVPVLVISLAGWILGIIYDRKITI